MGGDNNFLISDPPIDEALHDFVALGIEANIGARLRDATA